MKSKLFILTVFTAMVFSAMSFTSGAFAAQKADNVLDVAMNSSIKDGLDPAVIVIEASGTIMRNTYERLIEAESDGKTLIPGLASSWEVSKDGLEYTFNLRKGVEFFDGSKFTARDVKYSFTRAMDLNKGVAWTLRDHIDSILVIDDSTLKIKIKKPFAPFARILTNPMVCSILSEETSKKHATKEDPWATKYYLSHINGTGVFAFVEWKPNEYLSLKRNEKYWGEKASADGIIFHILPEPETASMMLRKGELDVSDSLPNELVEYLSKKDGITIVSKPVQSHFSFVMNTSLPPMDNVKVRQALALAMDYSAMMQHIVASSGQRMNGYIMPGMLAYDEKLAPIQQDIKKAKALLKEAGFPKGLDIEIPYPVWGALPDVCVLAQASFALAGIRVKLVQQGFGPFMEGISTNKTMIFPWAGSPYYNDPDGTMYANLHSRFIGKGSGGNVQCYNNPEMDKLLEQGRYEQDENKRIAAYQKANAIFNRDLPRFYLWQDVRRIVLRDNIKGFEIPFFGAVNFTNVSVQQ